MLVSMKKLLVLFACLLGVNCVGFETQPQSIVLRRQDTRVPRFCFIREDHSLACYRDNGLCLEAMFETRYVNQATVRRECSYFLVERSLLPYWDQYQ
jgi:hypothetical protein